MTKRTAAIYCRISPRPDGQTMAGVNRQRADCEALVERRGWVVGGLYLDDDVSAYSRKPRPQYLRMCADLRTGAVDAVIVWHPDRLLRSPRELEDFIDLIELTGAEWATCTAGDIDLSTSEGRFLARITAGVARKESEDKSRRLRRKHEEIAAEGRPTGGGLRPFGYAKDRVTVVPTEATLIRDGASRILAGDSVRSVTRDWQATTPTVGGAERWATVTVRQILMSYRISGQREHHGKLVAPGTWPAIITPDETARLRVILSDPARDVVAGKRARRTLLNGFLRCGKCDARLVSGGTAGRPRYHCAPDAGGCSGCGVSATGADSVITTAVIHRFAGTDIDARLAEAAAEQAGDAEAFEAVAQIEAHLEQLARDHYADRLISRGEFLAARGPLERQLDAARTAVARRRPAAVLHGVGEPGKLAEAWPTLSLDRRRAIVGSVIDHIVLAPTERGANRFDPGRLTQIAWRIAG